MKESERARERVFKCVWKRRGETMKEFLKIREEEY